MIEIVFIISLFIFGVYKIINDEDMILHFLVKYLEKLPIFLQSPLYKCITCMASFYTFIFWLFYDFNLIVTMICVAGLNNIINYFYEY